MLSSDLNRLYIVVHNALWAVCLLKSNFSSFSWSISQCRTVEYGMTRNLLALVAISSYMKHVVTWVSGPRCGGRWSTGLPLGIFWKFTLVDGHTEEHVRDVCWIQAKRPLCYVDLMPTLLRPIYLPIYILVQHLKWKINSPEEDEPENGYLCCRIFFLRCLCMCILE